LIYIKVSPINIDDAGKYLVQLIELMNVEPRKVVLHFNGGFCRVDLSGEISIEGSKNDVLVRMFTEKQLCKI